LVIKIKGGNQKISEWKGKGSLDFLLLKWELISEGAERFYVICMFTFNILTFTISISLHLPYIWTYLLSGNLSRLDWRRERGTGGVLLERRIRARHDWHPYVEQAVC